MMGEKCCCIDIDYPPTIHTVRMRKARKEHKCGECGDSIKKGDKYEHVTGLWEGDWDTHKTCSMCVRIRSDFFQCGFYYGQLRADLRECYGVEL